MTYPDYVKQYRPKGTVVKYSNGTYYVYYAKSERVPGKSYPVQKIGGLAGKIDQFGFHPIATIQLNTEHLMVRECGFTNFLLTFEDIYICDRDEAIKEKRNLYRSLIAYFSNNSYLYEDKDTTIYSPEQMASIFHMSIPIQVTKIGGMIQEMYGLKLEDLEPLKYICNVRIGDQFFTSNLTEAQKKLLEKLGITENEIKRQK